MSVEINSEKVVIQNNSIGKIFEIKGAKIASSKIHNKQCGALIEFESGSNEFVICFKGVLGGEYVKAEDLKIKAVNSEKINYKDRLFFDFKPFKIKGCKVDLRLVFELGEFDFFLKKYLVFNYEYAKGEKAVLDFIDFAPFSIADRSMSWRLPAQEKSIISGFALSLGQPVFYKSAFFGCEFPASVNTIEDDAVMVKRYYGKSLNELSGNRGTFVSDRAVCGVAPHNTYNSVRGAFLDYIDKISKKSKFRVQFNSWYDHMLDISTDKIQKSFFEIEKSLNSVGMEPLDSYVIDDGWNDYKSDFWRFNTKFPDELYTPSFLAQNLGSSFGLWIGPRGGYTKDTVKFARQIEEAGNGFVNKKSNDICVSSTKYVSKMQDFLLDIQKRFGIDYWKLDGFAQKPCTNKGHDHAVGGKDNIYFYSELWDKWIGVFEKLNGANAKPPHINLTCYAPPSPWLLQWVNTVWMQCSEDMGLVKKFDDGRKSGGSDKDKALTYRDGRYYEFYSERQFCFPAGRLYNHDPIYANKSGLKMSDDEFREYMFTNAARGTQFFELYFSPEMMSEKKWRIANSAILFAKENADILSRTVMFAGKPTAGQIYGYSAFKGNEGFITLRNPDSKEKDFVFVLDEKAGVSETLFEAPITYILQYGKTMRDATFSYGDTFRIALKPYETVIMHFGRRKKKLECVYKKAHSANTLEVMFNQDVFADRITCKENPIVKATLLEDRRSVLLAFQYHFIEENSLTLSGVTDLLYGESDIKINFRFFENYRIRKTGIEGTEDFTIKLKPNGEYIYRMFSQGDEVQIYIQNNRVMFKVGDTLLCSRASADEIYEVAAVRERNGCLKLYLNGKLDSGISAKPYYVENRAPISFDGNKTEIYCRALSYDEIK